MSRVIAVLSHRCSGTHIIDERAVLPGPSCRPLRSEQLQQLTLSNCCSQETSSLSRFDAKCLVRSSFLPSSRSRGSSLALPSRLPWHIPSPFHYLHNLEPYDPCPKHQHPDSVLPCPGRLRHLRSASPPTSTAPRPPPRARPCSSHFRCLW